MEQYSVEKFKTQYKQFNAIVEKKFPDKGLNSFLDIIIEIDPTYKKDSKQVGKYAEWILRRCATSEVNSMDYLQSDLKPLLLKFNNITKRLNNSEDKESLTEFEPDITKYSTITELKSAVTRFINYTTKSTESANKRIQYGTDVETLLDSGELVLLCESSNWMIFTPLTDTQSIVIGKNTKWCIQQAIDNKFSSLPYKDQPFLIAISKILIDSKSRELKYQFHSMNNGESVWDSSDKEIMLDDMYKLFKKNNGLQEQIVNQYKNIKLLLTKSNGMNKSNEFKYNTNNFEFNKIYNIQKYFVNNDLAKFDLVTGSHYSWLDVFFESELDKFTIYLGFQKETTLTDLVPNYFGFLKHVYGKYRNIMDNDMVKLQFKLYKNNQDQLEFMVQNTQDMTYDLAYALVQQDGDFLGEIYYKHKNIKVDDKLKMQQVENQPLQLEYILKHEALTIEEKKQYVSKSPLTLKYILIDDINKGIKIDSNLIEIQIQQSEGAGLKTFLGICISSGRLVKEKANIFIDEYLDLFEHTVRNNISTLLTILEMFWKLEYKIDLVNKYHSLIVQWFKGVLDTAVTTGGSNSPIETMEYVIELVITDILKTKYNLPFKDVIAIFNDYLDLDIPSPIEADIGSKIILYIIKTYPTDDVLHNIDENKLLNRVVQDNNERFLIKLITRLKLNTSDPLQFRLIRQYCAIYPWRLSEFIYDGIILKNKNQLILIDDAINSIKQKMIDFPDTPDNQYNNDSMRSLIAARQRIEDQIQLKSESKQQFNKILKI